MVRIQQVTPYIFTRDQPALSAFPGSTGFAPNLAQHALGHTHCESDVTAHRRSQLRQSYGMRVLYLSDADNGILMFDAKASAS